MKTKSINADCIRDTQLGATSEPADWQVFIARSCLESSKEVLQRLVLVDVCLDRRELVGSPEGPIDAQVSVRLVSVFVCHYSLWRDGEWDRSVDRLGARALWTASVRLLTLMK